MHDGHRETPDRPQISAATTKRSSCDPNWHKILNRHKSPGAFIPGCDEDSTALGGSAGQEKSVERPKGYGTVFRPGARPEKKMTILRPIDSRAHLHLRCKNESA